MVELIRRWKRAASDILQRMGREPTSSEVAKILDLTPQRLAIVLRAMDAQSFGASSDGPELIHDLPDKPAEEKGITSDFDIEEISKAMNAVLSEREKLILRLRYGLAGEEPMTLEKIGGRIGLTRERIRQIQAHALRKLFVFLTGEVRAPDTRRRRRERRAPTRRRGKKK